MEPKQKISHTDGSSRKLAGDVKLRLPMGLTIGGSVAGDSTSSTTLESSFESSAPAWRVVEEGTRDRFRNAIHGTCRSIAISILRRSQKNTERTKIDVEYGISAVVDPKQEEPFPNLSGTYRHQLHCWISVGTKTKGIVILSAVSSQNRIVENPTGNHSSFVYSI